MKKIIIEDKRRTSFVNLKQIDVRIKVIRGCQPIKLASLIQKKKQTFCKKGRQEHCFAIVVNQEELVCVGF